MKNKPYLDLSIGNTLALIFCLLTSCFATGDLQKIGVIGMIYILGK